ncbi:MAG TPA: hypothetical protein VFA37_01670 [Gaiellaceae bacterium]|nr:hypothetical protein [Gaiellaceae bacterium]
MRREVALGVSAALVLASWGICGLSYATNGGGEYSGLFFFFIWVAVFLTGSAAIVLVRAWLGKASVLAAAPVSALAALSILWLALAIGLRG